MFSWKEKRNRQEQFEKLTSTESTAVGSNRRAINLVPLPAYQDKREVSKSHHVRYHQLLVSIEAKQSTCCLRIINPNNKSRSAILVFRGRVLGSLYGRKDLPEQIFGQEAHRLSIAELAHPENILDTYLLSEELVLAGAALFHGLPLSIPRGSAEDSFEWSSMQLTRSNTPGCIVINNAENLAVCMVYIFGGRIVGVYSFKRGWVEPSYEAALKHVLNTRGAAVVASGLTARNVEEVIALTFSLTGLGDRNETNIRTTAKFVRSETRLSSSESRELGGYATRIQTGTGLMVDKKSLRVSGQSLPESNAADDLAIRQRRLADNAGEFIC